MSIKVVDLQNEEAKEERANGSLNSNSVRVEPPALETIEEEPKPVETPEVVNEVVEETNEEPTPKQEQTEEPPKPKPKPKPKASDIVQCPDCSRSMTYKNLRYSHKCSPEPPPVKKQAKPKAKQTPKPKPTSKHEVLSRPRNPPPEIYYSDEEEEVPTQPLIKKKQPVPVQPINPVDAMAQHYLVLQQQFIKQKQERYNNLCMNMFSSKTKKR